jgi:uncharacterized membrane protein (UPF0136 family)
MKKFSPARYMTLYGVVVMVAGLIGFLTSGSAASLISSGIFGVMALIAGYGLGKNLGFAKPLGLFTVSLLGLFFMWRTVQGSAFPALAIVGLSLIGLAFLLDKRIEVTEPPKQ